MAAVNSKNWNGTMRLAFLIACFLSFFVYFVISHIAIWNFCQNLQSSSASTLPRLKRVVTFLLDLLNLSDPLEETKIYDRDRDTAYQCNKTLLTTSLFIITSKFFNDLNVLIITVWNVMMGVINKSFIMFSNSYVVESLQRRHWKETPLYICIIVLVTFLFLVGLMIRKYFILHKKSALQKNHVQVQQKSSLALTQSSLTRHTKDCPTEISMRNQGHKSLSKMCLFFVQRIVFLIAFSILLSIPWEFVRLYQKAVASRAARVNMGLPPECVPSTLGWVDSIKSLLKWHLSWTHDDSPCADYYYALLVDPLWEVNPLLVVSSVLSRGIVHPLEVISSSLGRSVRIFFAEIPAHWQPVILLASVATTVTLLLMLCRYRLSIPLFLRIEPKTPVSSPADANSKEKHLRLNENQSQQHLYPNYFDEINLSNRKMGDTAGSISPKYKTVSSRPLRTRKLNFPNKN